MNDQALGVQREDNRNSPSGSFSRTPMSSFAGAGDGGEERELEASWRSLSDFLRLQCGGTTTFVLSGNKDAVNYLRMRPARKAPITVGGIEAKVYEFRVLPPKMKSEDSNRVESQSN